MLFNRIALFLVVFFSCFYLYAATPVEKSQVLKLGERVADWQLKQLGYLPGVDPLPKPRSKSTAWEIGAFWVGMLRFAEQTQLPRYKNALLQQGQKNQWQLGPVLAFADDHVIGQSYLWANKHGVGAEALQAMQQTFDKILEDPPEVHLSFYYAEEDGYHSAACLVRWCWCDALFMSPPAMLGLSLVTGDRKYADYAFSEFWATTDFLYDPVEKLYFRDSRFFEMRDEKKRKLFWSRGNGWVFAGIANMLDLMPNNHPERSRLETLFKEMAARLVDLQKSDGYWAPSLLALENSPRESSGTAFFTYGLAYGINHKILPDDKQYRQAAHKGWQALEKAVATDGRLGWVQQVSDRPELVREEDTHYYGVGAFLLAASEVANLLTR